MLSEEFKDKAKYDAKVVGVFLAIVFVCLSVFCIYKYFGGSRANTDNYNVTVQQAKDNNDTAIRAVNRASKQIRDTQSELNAGQAALDSASDTTYELQQSISNSSEQLDDSRRQLESCKRSLNEQQQILDEIARANGLSN